MHCLSILGQGYAAISSFVNCHHLRQIRGDNYCSIRAVLFQALVGGLPILNKFEIGKKRKINQVSVINGQT